MANYNYAVKIVKSLGGRANSQSTSNIYNIESSATLADGDFDELLTHLVDAEKLAHYDAVHFLRGTVTELVQTPLQVMQGHFLSRELEGLGARVLGAKKLMPDNVCLGVKRVSKLDHNGMLYYRWCLTRDDVSAGADRDYVISDPTIFRGGGSVTDSLIQRLNEVLPEGRFIFPNKPNNFLDANRMVDSHALAGVVFKQANNSRKSADAAVDDASERKIRSLERGILDIILGTPFDDLAPANAVIVVSALNDIRELLSAMTPKRALGVVLNGALKALPGGS